LRGTVEDEPHRALVAVLGHEHDRASEVGVENRRRGHQQLALERRSHVRIVTTRARSGAPLANRPFRLSTVRPAIATLESLYEIDPEAKQPDGTTVEQAAVALERKLRACGAQAREAPGQARRVRPGAPGHTRGSPPAAPGSPAHTSGSRSSTVRMVQRWARRRRSESSSHASGVATGAPASGRTA